MLSTMRDKNRQRLEKAGAVLFALIVWQIASLMLGQELLLVSPIKVVQRLLSLCAVPDFWDSIGFSFVRIMEGFFTALLAGTVLAVAAGRFHLVDVLLWPFMAAIKATPVASFIILCLVWLNSASLSVFIAFLMVLPIIYTNMLEGITNTDKKLLEMADVFHIGLFRRIHYIYLPQLMPYFLAACCQKIGHELRQVDIMNSAKQADVKHIGHLQQFFIRIGDALQHVGIDDRQHHQKCNKYRQAG